MYSLLTCSHLLLLPLFAFEHISSKNTFKVEFQSSGYWSKDEWLEHEGKIPQLWEFTACHWEKLIYFSKALNVIWSYCMVKTRSPEKLNCVQLFYSGNRTTANRGVIFHGWFSGWTDETIDIKLQVNDFSHRSWNHFCWSYSSITGINQLYYNGMLVAEALIDEGLPHPIIDGSDTASEYAFIVGQEPDTIRGGYNSDQSFYGNIAELNLWNKIIGSDEIKAMASCNKYSRGNVIAWEKKTPQNQ